MDRKNAKTCQIPFLKLGCSALKKDVRKLPSQQQLQFNIFALVSQRRDAKMGRCNPMPNKYLQRGKTDPKGTQDQTPLGTEKVALGSVGKWAQKPDHRPSEYSAAARFTRRRPTLLDQSRSIGVDGQTYLKLLWGKANSAAEPVEIGAKHLANRF